MPEETTVNGVGENGENLDLLEIIHQPTWKTLLLDLVKASKMDPWAIDVSVLADQYLKKINALGELSLRIPANAILCSAILLKYKSKTLKIPSIEAADERLTEEQLKARQRLFLAEGIPELVAPRLVREGKVSLDDLVSAIENVLVSTKKKRLMEREKERVKFEIPFAQENIEERKGEVLKCLEEHKDVEGLVLFSRLVKDKGATELIGTFVALLFLNNEGKVNMWQDDFFGEIFIALTPEDKAPAEGETVNVPAGD